LNSGGAWRRRGAKSTSREGAQAPNNSPPGRKTGRRAKTNCARGKAQRDAVRGSKCAKASPKEIQPQGVNNLACFQKDRNLLRQGPPAVTVTGKKHRASLTLLERNAARPGRKGKGKARLRPKKKNKEGLPTCEPARRRYEQLEKKPTARNDRLPNRGSRANAHAETLTATILDDAKKGGEVMT